MQRRKLLVGSGATLSAIFAGCTSDNTKDVEGGTRDDDDDNSSDGSAEDDNGSDDDNSEPNVEIGNHELVVSEGQFSTEVYVEATIENTGDAPSGNIELQADWYDSDDNYLDNDRSWLISLGAGETWEGRIHYLGSNSEDVDDYELEGEFSERSGEQPDHLEPQDVEMEVGDNEVVVSGTIENTGDADESYVAAIAKIYDGDGIVMGDDYTNVTDLRASESWAFDVSWRGRDRVSRAEDYELMVADTA